jgi:hypothetical protein
LLLGAAAGTVSAALFSMTHGADFAQFHYHARVWLEGKDPYAGGFPVMRSTRMVPEPLFYPLPSVVATAPFALLPLRFATAAFIGLCSGLLAFGLVLRAPQKLPLFLGAGFFVALGLGQWSPLMTATVLLPPLAWLAVLKPNLGLAITAAKPTWPGVLGGGGLLLASLALQPNWPAEWVRNLHSMPGHPIPVLEPGGAILLIAVVRWRRAEARLLLTMACVPQLMYFADQLPLWLVPQTRRESMALSATSLIAWLASLEITTRAGRQPAFGSDAFVLVGVYAPVLFMVIRRPNEGQIPIWLERVVSPLPDVLRGRATDGTVMKDPS